MNKNRSILKTFCGAILIFCAMHRGALDSMAENTGASFLKLGIGARQVGMGNAFTGIADDVSAVYWNPAGLSKLTQRQIGAMHSEWVGDIRYDFLGFVMPLHQSPFEKGGKPGGFSPGKALGISILYLYMGDIEGRNEDRSVSGNFTSYDMAVTLSYSQRINSTLNLGGNLKFISETIEKESAKGLGMDFGLLYKPPIKDLTLGLNIQNLGPSMKFINESYNLPLSITGGIGYSLFNIFTVSMDIKNQLIDGKTDVSVGTEISPMKTLSFRAGYITSLINAVSSRNTMSNLNQIKDITGLAAGLGFKFSGYQLDYSFAPYGNLGDSHRVSIIKGF